MLGEVLHTTHVEYEHIVCIHRWESFIAKLVVVGLHLGERK